MKEIEQRKYRKSPVTLQEQIIKQTTNNFRKITECHSEDRCSVSEFQNSKFPGEMVEC